MTASPAESSSGLGPRPVPPVLPRYVGVRCSCGAYIALGGEHEPFSRHRLDRSAWILCPGCNGEKLYGRRDVISFAWPPE